MSSLRRRASAPLRFTWLDSPTKTGEGCGAASRFVLSALGRGKVVGQEGTRRRSDAKARAE